MAQKALAQAKALFAAGGSSVGFARGTTVPATAPDGRDATMVLTRLAHHVDDLTSPDDRVAAKALLARPTYGGTPSEGEHSYQVPEQTPDCSTTVPVCVHYVTTDTSYTGHQSDNVSRTDTTGPDGQPNGIPDYVDTTLATLEHVWSTEVSGMGYRRPVDDGSLADHGVDGGLDVYLQDLATNNYGLYGYCAPDTNMVQTPGYCVLENDYAESVFGNHTPDDNLRVTAAHEFFHAVQSAYNSYQDEWLMEGTAAWIEDEVYSDINDNRQYLAASPLSRSWHPLDHGDYTNPYFPPYGSWIFWRFLSESFHGPNVIREIWQRAPRVYSTTALRKTLAAHGSSFATVFARFGNWSRNPSRYFREGTHYRAAKLSHSTFTLSRSALSTGNRTAHIDHMAQRYYRFVPGSSISGKWHLRLSVNMADKARGSLAQVSVHWRSGALTVVGVKLDRHGNGHKSVAFQPSRVSSVELDMINDSTRFACNRGSDETCGGYAYDDGRTDVFRATAWK